MEEQILEQQRQIIDNQNTIIDLLHTMHHEFSLARSVKQALALKKQGYIDATHDRIKTERSTEGRD